jgi:hypothetical protein
VSERTTEWILDDASNELSDASCDTVTRPEQRPGKAFAQIPIDHVTTAAMLGPTSEAHQDAIHLHRSRVPAHVSSLLRLVTPRCSGGQGSSNIGGCRLGPKQNDGETGLAVAHKLRQAAP